MKNRNLLRLSIAIFATVGAAIAEEHVTTIRWSATDQANIGQVVATEGEEELLIANEADRPLRTTIATLQPTGISTFHYSVRGTIRYEDVEQPGHLELWSHFPDGGQFFTRTMSDAGPMSTIHGTSGPREFDLPFQSSEEHGVPTKLEINLILPAAGKVWIGPLSVLEMDAGELNAAVTPPGAWWSMRTSGLVGGIAGAVLGILGAMIGILSGMGQARTTVIGIGWSVLVFGLICLGVGIVALVTTQPYYIYFPLLLTGIVCSGTTGLILPTIKRRYADAELHRMSAMDTGSV